MPEAPGLPRAGASRAARPRPGRPRRRGVAGAAAALVAAGTLAACGSDGGTQTLTWYINPDSGGQAEIASRCTDAADGRYRITVSQLPRDSPSQREQLVRRLAAEDDSIDIMSLDPPYIPEFAQAGFLAPVPDDVADRVTEDVVQSAIEGSTWDDQLVAVPFWANTQLLWYRKSVVEEAGLDMSQPVTWEQVVEAARSTGTTVSVQGIRSESLTVWVNALIESAGGSVIEEEAEAPEDYQFGLTSEAGVRAAEVLQMISDSGTVGPAFTTANEDSNATQFEGETGGFMVNWPFVWPRAQSGVEAGTLDQSVPDDYGWALYPRVDADQESAPPYGGINLGIGAFSRNVDFAFEAAECIVSEENQAYYFTTNGNPAAKSTVFDDPDVVDVFPQAPVIRQSLEQAAPRPLTPYYSEVSGSIQRDYHPTTAVDPEATPERATDLITAVLSGEELL
ncbi:ABC transporter substrate-binding protein [Blastococcus sp. TF02-09]|uniref:extracellular solute-binding protein n=1 Tax=Blastococcus sp. TF02-09 TaxID=2250576 RepID=UPI000DE9C578|nr:extracellular solute-binding protein [Blastococcus sp. TF02-9]RBY79205.1 ABC transporter substrate-binding protein [Blastococcus sp. TF02-9]